jgi:hypothetical protein
VWYPRLLQASVEEREQFRLIGSGEGIHMDGNTRASRRLEPIEKRLTVEEYIASQSESAQPVLKRPDIDGFSEIFRTGGSKKTLEFAQKAASRRAFGKQSHTREPWHEIG